MIDLINAALLVGLLAAIFTFFLGIINQAMDRIPNMRLLTLFAIVVGIIFFAGAFGVMEITRTVSNG